MNFDEAIDMIDVNGTLIDTLGVLQALQQEYAPTIEIVPDMKWFVRSKEPEDEDEDYLFLSGYNLDDLDYFEFDYARAFDTKEEAELWTNPLTEAVQLPVEGER